MGQSADIWALGVIMYKLLTGNFPFRGLNDKILYKKILKGEYMKSLDVSGEANELIERMLSMNASERPTAQMLLRSNWIMDKKKMGY
jgi:MAP/microtubule affinity-regulating kinase